MTDKKVPKTIYISAKCSDLFDMNVLDANDKLIASYSGDVPTFMPEKGGLGESIQMKIDIKTGRILNWKNPIGHSHFNAILEGKGEDSEESD